MPYLLCILNLLLILSYYSAVVLSTGGANDAQIKCRAGHWPLKHHCQTLIRNPWALIFDSKSDRFLSAIDYPDSIRTIWNITRIDRYKSDSSVDVTAMCSASIPCAVFSLLQYDPSLFGLSGTNFYVFIVDVLLPLFNFLSTMNCSISTAVPDVFLFQYTDGIVNVATSGENAFHQLAYYSELPQLLWGQRYHSATSSTFLGLLSKNAAITSDFDGADAGAGSRLCFDRVAFGTPDYSNPSSKVVKRFSEEIRMKSISQLLQNALRGRVAGTANTSTTTTIIISLIDSSIRESRDDFNSNFTVDSSILKTIENLNCKNEVKHIGLVTRLGRRRILNERELKEYIELRLSHTKVRFISFGSRYYSVQPKQQLEEYSAELLSKSESDVSIVEEVVSIQDLSVLIGIQGSGLTNGLFLPATSSVVALYYSASWPIVSGDPLSLLQDRGPYFKHICNPGKCELTCMNQSSVLNMQEEYSNNCDSSDVIIDPQEFLSIINKALLLNNRACQKELLKG